MQFDRQKLRDVILYACSLCEPVKMGAVKLHKVLYFSDMLHYASVGAPLTGATYRKRPMGPTCDQLLSILSELAREGALTIREVDYFGYRKKEYVATDVSDGGNLSGQERALLAEMVEFVCANNTAKTISEFSHNKAWDIVKFGDVISYNSVFNIFPTQVSPDAWEWAGRETRAIEAERSRNEPMESRVFSTLRKKVLAGIR